jgi:hypothetical protein
VVELDVESASGVVVEVEGAVVVESGVVVLLVDPSPVVVVVLVLADPLVPPSRPSSALAEPWPSPLPSAGAESGAVPHGGGQISAVVGSRIRSRAVRRSGRVAVALSASSDV